MRRPTPTHVAAALVVIAVAVELLTTTLLFWLPRYLLSGTTRANYLDAVVDPIAWSAGMLLTVVLPAVAAVGAGALVVDGSGPRRVLGVFTAAALAVGTGVAAAAGAVGTPLDPIAVIRHASQLTGRYLLAVLVGVVVATISNRSL